MNELAWTDPAGTRHERCQLFFVSAGASVAFNPGEHPEMRWPRSGWALYCHWCGEIWDRVAMLDSRGVQLPLTCISVACRKHPDSWNVPGSLLAGELEHLLNYLPLELLRREFEVHLQYLAGESLDRASIAPA